MAFVYGVGITDFMIFVWLIAIIVFLILGNKTIATESKRYLSAALGALIAFISVLLKCDRLLQIAIFIVSSMIIYLLMKNKK